MQSIPPGSFVGLLLQKVVLVEGMLDGGRNAVKGRVLADGTVAAVSHVRFLDVFFGETVVRSAEDAALDVDQNTVKQVTYDVRTLD